VESESVQQLFSKGRIFVTGMVQTSFYQHAINGDSTKNAEMETSAMINIQKVLSNKQL
jgi:hypothetical protein